MLTEYEAQKLQADMRRGSHRSTLVEERHMVSHAERQKLMRHYHREPASVLGLVLKCAVCAVILVGLAVIGSRTELRRETPLVAPAADGATHPQERASLADSRNEKEGAGKVNTTRQ